MATIKSDYPYGELFLFVGFCHNSLVKFCPDITAPGRYQLGITDLTEKQTCEALHKHVKKSEDGDIFQWIPSDFPLTQPSDRRHADERAAQVAAAKCGRQRHQHAGGYSTGLRQKGRHREVPVTGKHSYGKWTISIGDSGDFLLKPRFSSGMFMDFPLPCLNMFDIH